MKKEDVIRLVCFIDLLGTKESSKVSGDDYSKAINEFKETLKESKHLLKQDSEICLFSDCAFMAVEYPSTDVLDFLNNIRTTLFAKGFYFKCSLNPGKFCAYQDNDTKGFSSVTFPPSAVDSYLLHEQFKGLGFIISQKIFDVAWSGPKDALNDLVQSVFIGGPNRNEVIRYHDIPFGEKYRGNNKYSIEKKEKLKIGGVNHSAEIYFEQYLEDFMIARTKNETYAIYYLPSLITMIRSSDFKDLHYSEGDWTGAPLIFCKLFLEQRTLKRILSIPRSEIVYCAAVEKVYQDSNQGDIIKDYLATFFSNKQKLKKGISNIPAFVFGGENRNDFIRRIAKIELSL